MDEWLDLACGIPKVWALSPKLQFQIQQRSHFKVTIIQSLNKALFLKNKALWRVMTCQVLGTQ
jgi:hypothetical protein